MSDKKTTTPSPTSIERARRKLVEQQEGAQRMVEVEREGVALRKNMERLRALRLAREAEEAAAALAAPPAAPKKRTRKTTSLT
ncbi:hypothetical protein [Rhodopseudomonas palustris]|uniref:Transcriptional regulator n=1 Tax=Rhodopseudomonas palustris (strain ATCC BAA-98 / CGA009) TaxID=258594 RepID=Q6N4D9_RHOPA|nr:hypothetical protein [Rhodopseudomonas palustris]ACF02377.1 conserved hypothetical protein [Rhodopseudomonas palustris TIE-1]OPF96626.1 transcriptional regulator [Rhodopseudomonas palustris]PPQ44095.1 transcriptional regulator [Rhodopseudomonas palustris]QLH72414.1 transcriptional regulator [Rhodopseudomonas palustris]QQM04936.1 hypothetical protein I8G32_03501 [Rhodopseudomonas palustris]